MMAQPSKSSSKSKDKHGYSQELLQIQTMYVNHPKGLFGFTNYQTGIFQYPESYERTKLAEQELDVPETSEEREQGPEMVESRLITSERETAAKAIMGRIVNEKLSKIASKRKSELDKIMSNEDAKMIPPPATPRRVRFDDNVQTQVIPPRLNPDRAEYHLVKMKSEARGPRVQENVTRVKIGSEVFRVAQRQGMRVPDDLNPTFIAHAHSRHRAAQEAAWARAQIARQNEAVIRHGEEAALVAQERGVRIRYGGEEALTAREHGTRVRHGEEEAFTAKGNGTEIQHRQEEVLAARENGARIRQGSEEVSVTQYRAIAPRLSPTPILPRYIRIVRADHYMRITHTTPIVCINQQKFVQLDDHHLVPAWTDPRLVVGDNMTIRERRNADWDGKKKGGRPRVLCYLFPFGAWDFTPELNRPKKPPVAFEPEIFHGHIVINGRDKALKASVLMPVRCSTDIEGWEMEALYRYDTNLCHQDFIDRMLANLPPGKSIPTIGTLNHRRRRDRLKMRVIPWPTPNHLSYSDQQIFKELGHVGVRQNITWNLHDLTKEQIEMHTAITYGGHLERSGGKAQDYPTRVAKFRENLRLVRSQYADNTEEVRLVLANISLGLRSMGHEFRIEDWAPGVFWPGY